VVGSPSGRGRKARIVAIEQVATVFLVTFEWAGPPTGRNKQPTGRRWQLNHKEIQFSGWHLLPPKE
jgi:hypothetical protein